MQILVIGLFSGAKIMLVTYISEFRPQASKMNQWQK